MTWRPKLPANAKCNESPTYVEITKTLTSEIYSLAYIHSAGAKGIMLVNNTRERHL